MESLAIGLSLICLLYILVFLVLEYGFDGWASHPEVKGRWFRIRRMVESRFRNWNNTFSKDKPKNAL